MVARTLPTGCEIRDGVHNLYIMSLHKNRFFEVELVVFEQVDIYVESAFNL
jgi:hypothetical protein